MKLFSSYGSLGNNLYSLIGIGANNQINCDAKNYKL